MKLIRKVRSRLRKLFRGIETTFLYQHDLTDVMQMAAPAGSEVRPLRQSEEPLLDEISPVCASIAKRLTEGECYIGLFDGKAAHYSWVQTRGTHRIDDAARNVDVEPGELWIYHCETAPWARGKRLYPCTLSRILESYRDQGFRRAWIYTTADNLSSQKGIGRAGFVLQCRLRALHLPGVSMPLKDR